MQATKIAGEPSRLQRLAASIKPATGTAWWMYSWIALGAIGGICLAIASGSFLPLPICIFIGFAIGSILLIIGKLAGIAGVAGIAGDSGDISF